MATFAAVIVLRVSFLFAAALLVTALMRRSSAAARHLVWTCAIAGSLVVPLLSFTVPAWELPLLPAIQTRLTEFVPAQGSEVPLVRSLGYRFEPLHETQRPGTVGPAAHIPDIAGSRWGVPALAVFFWLAGLLLVVGRLALGTIRMRWVARRARRIGEGRWLRLAERLAEALGVAKRVVFLEGRAGAMPMTWGVVISRVLLPRTAESWPPPRQRVVILHELAHVKRRDCLTQLVAQLSCAVYWFNPLAWLAARRLRAEREHACDDVVLASGIRGSEYADHLLDIARSMRSTMAPTWAAVAMAHRSQLEGRLMAILDPGLPRRLPTRRRSIALVAFMTVLVIPIALVTPAPRAAEVVSAQPMESPRTPQPSATSASASARQPAPRRSERHSDRALASTLKEALRDAIPDATSDLAREGWLPAIAVDAARAIAVTVGQAVAEGVSGGVVGGVKGGIKGGIKGGVARTIEQEIEKEMDAPRRDPRVVTALVEALKDSDRQVRESAMQALADMRAPEALDAIRALLKDTNPSVREQAAFSLGQYRDRASVDVLTGALQDSSSDVREQAVFALGQIGDPRSAAPLTQALKDTDACVREQAAFALGQLRATDAVEPLAAALHDRSADVREQAAFALGQIRDRRAVDALLASLNDESADVREQAAFALGQLRDPRAIDGLAAALKDPNADVRRQAALALSQLSR